MKITWYIPLCELGQRYFEFSHLLCLCLTKTRENNVIFILLVFKSIFTIHSEDNYKSYSNSGMLLYLLSFQTLIPMKSKWRDSRKKSQEPLKSFYVHSSDPAFYLNIFTHYWFLGQLVFIGQGLIQNTTIANELLSMEASNISFALKKYTYEKRFWNVNTQ